MESIVGLLSFFIIMFVYIDNNKREIKRLNISENERAEAYNKLKKKVLISCFVCSSIMVISFIISNLANKS